MSLDMSPYYEKTTKIIGPPGTGKTHTLMQEVSKIIADGHNGREIGFFAFTNFASDVALKRIQEESDLKAINSSGFRTLHSQAYRCLAGAPKLMTRAQALEYDKSFLEKIVYREPGSPKEFDHRLEHPVVDVFATARSKRIDFRTHLKSLRGQSVAILKEWLGSHSSKYSPSPLTDSEIEKLIKFEEDYTHYKKTLDVIDHTDTLEMAVEVDDDAIPAYKFVFVDEAQDLSRLQWEFAAKLFAKAEKIFLAGDEDQAICESFGAEPQIFVNFPCKNPHPLKESHRVPKAMRNDIFKHEGIVAELQKRFPRHENKNWHSREGNVLGFTGTLNWQACLSLICAFPKKEWLIMAATHQTIGAISNYLKKEGIAHTLSNKRIPEDTNNPNIQLKTIWGAKGGESDCTVLLRDGNKDEEMYSEDTRLLYVAKTRAKKVHIDASDDEIKPPPNFLSEPRRSKEDYEIMIATLEDKQPEFANDGGKNSNYPILLDARYGERRIFVRKLNRICDVPCIEIELDDGTCRAKTFDNLNDTLAQAKQLIGKRVALDVWGNYDPKKWFNNIREAKD